MILQSVVFSLWVGVVAASASAQKLPYHSLQLVGRASTSVSVKTSESDALWLKNKKTIIVAVSAPDYPPLDKTINGLMYEGITADYAGLLGELLGVGVEARQFESRELAIEALKRGEVDLLGSSNSYELADPELMLSTSYLDDQPVLLTRIGEDKVLDTKLAGKRIAMLNHYIPLEDVQAFYPDATIQLFSSTISAIGAVEFGQADVYLGDLVSTSHLASNSFYRNVQPANFSAMHVADFAFALTKNNTRLKRLVDQALQAIPSNENMYIVRRWDINGIYFFGDKKVQYGAQEKKWIADHRVVKVLVDPNYPPVSFIKDGKVQGVVNDIVKELSVKTGLSFQLLPVTYSSSQIAQKLTAGDFDLVGALSPNLFRDPGVSFSRPYLTNTLVMMARRNDSSVTSLESLSGKVVASLKGSTINAFISEHYPLIRILELDTVSAGIDRVNAGEASAVVDSLIAATYKINHDEYPDLKIISTIGDNPEAISLAMSNKDHALFSIIDKALLSIPAAKMDSISEFWINPTQVESSFF